MDLQTLKNRIIGRGIASSLEPYIYDWVNEAYRELWNMYDWNFKYTTGTLPYTPGTQLYLKTLIASNVGKIEFIYDSGTGKRLDRVTNFKGIDIDPKLTSANSYPLSYSDLGTQIRLYPAHTNSGTLTVAYQKDISDLSSLTDEPLIPSRWQQVIIELAYAKALFYDDDNRAGSQSGVAMQQVREMKKEQNENSDEINTLGFRLPNTGEIK